MPWLDTGWKPHVGVKCSGHCMGCVRPICFIVFCWKLMFCVFSGKKKKSHPDIISSPMGMTFKKNTLSSGHCPNWGGNPLPKLILALFEKWEKLPTLACGEGTYVFFLEVSWGPNLQSSLWRLPNHKKKQNRCLFFSLQKKSWNQEACTALWQSDCRMRNWLPKKAKKALQQLFTNK